MEKDSTEDRYKFTTPNKFLLIVVGRMGQGKSSFCKMIVDNQQKGNIKAYTSMKSGTKVCSVYRSNMFKDVLNEDLYILDTPGLDSRTDASLIVEDIDDLIIRYRCQIVGVAYVIDINQRQQNQLGKNFIFTFLNLLRIKYIYKINLTFLIFSKYDERHKKTESNQALKAQLKRMFKEQKYQMIFPNNMDWISEPEKDIQAFYDQLKAYKKLKEYYNNQLSLLKEIINRNKQYFLSFDKFLQDRNVFQQILINSLKNPHKKAKSRKIMSKHSLLIEVSSKLNSKQKTAMVLGIPGVLALYGAAVEVGAAITTGLLGFILSPVVLTVAGGVGVISGIWGTYKYFTKKQNKIQKVCQQELLQFLHGRYQEKIVMCLLNEAVKQVKCNGNVACVNKTPFIAKVSWCNGNQQQEWKVFQQTKNVWTADLDDGSNKISFMFIIPSRQDYEQFLQEITTKFYNQSSFIQID